MRQIEQLVHHAEWRKAGYAAVLAGDFNCGPAVPDGGNALPALVLKSGTTVAACDRVSAGNYRRLGELGWQDTHTALGLPEQATWHPTANRLNAGGEHTSWGCPPQRIDGVFIQASELQATAGGVFLTEHMVRVPGAEKVPLSDHHGYWVTLDKARA